MESPTTTTIEVPTCQEDDPCWNCEEMGNMLCDPQVEIGEALVIERPAETEVLARTGMNETLIIVAIFLILCGGLFRVLHHFAMQGKRVLPWSIVIGLWLSVLVVAVV